MSDALTPIEVFCSYAPEDEPFFLQLQMHLSVLTHQERIVLWHRRHITPGTDWKQAIDTRVNRVPLILLLIIANFLHSDYYYGSEMKCVLERQRASEACVIPILIRPVDWEEAPFKHLKVLPTDTRPITYWHNQDEAFVDVTVGIRQTIKDLGHLFPTQLDLQPELVDIPDGPFLMGTTAHDIEYFRRQNWGWVKNWYLKEQYRWELSVHEVDLPAFKISRYPITNRQYKKFIEIHRSSSMSCAYTLDKRHISARNR